MIRWLAVNLDCPSPVALLTREGGNTGTTFDRSYSFKVSRTDLEVFEITVQTRDGTVTWGLDLNYEMGGETGTLKLRDPRLKVTSAAIGQEEVDGGTGQTVAMDQDDVSAIKPFPPCDAG